LPVAHGHEEESRLADWDFRIEQERETFRVYETRRLGVELQGTATTAAALTVSALLVAAATSQQVSELGGPVTWGIAPAIAGLLWTIAWATAARFAGWKWRGAPPERHDLDVKRTLDALREAPDDMPSDDLRRLALEHWNVRALSAWRLEKYKAKLLRTGLVGLTLPFAYLALLAVALV
jgi:hypothetical protein